MELIQSKVEVVGGSDVLNGFSEMEDYVVYQEIEMLSVRKFNIYENINVCLPAKICLIVKIVIQNLVKRQ